jgi:hypothetical protein
MLILISNQFIFPLEIKTQKKNDNKNMNFNQLSTTLLLKIKMFSKFTEEFQSLEKSEINYENFYKEKQTENDNIKNGNNFLNFSSDKKKDEEKEETRKIFAYYNTKNKRNLIFTSDKSNQSAENLIASGIYKKTRYIQGWDKLDLKTFSISKGNPLLQCFSAGFIEGAISTKEIEYYHHNLHVFFKGNPNAIEDIKNFYSIIDQNIRKKIKKENFSKLNLDDNGFKRLAYIACLHAQINGLYQGYNSQAKPDKKLTLLDFYFINSEGNFWDLKTYMKVNNMKFDNIQDFYKEENLLKFYNTSEISKIWKMLISKGHCSVIAKLVETPDGKKDIFAGHNTWSSYSELLRIMKFTSFAFEGENQFFGMKPKRMNYGSYPGVLFSGDDFYLLDSKVGVLQTTLSVINKFSYKNLINLDDYIPEFMRLQIVNFTSESGKEWVDNYKSFKDHMYITQWIVIDYNLLHQLNSGTPVKNNLILLLEEAPKSILSKDITEEFLQKGYYGSFNISYFKEHQDTLGMSHYSDIDFFDKNYNPRYFILQNLHSYVKNLEGFKDLMMYNGYKKKTESFKDDPSQMDPGNGISSRYDLDGSGSLLSGGIDFKVYLIVFFYMKVYFIFYILNLK